MDETGQPGGATPGINGNGRHHSEHTGQNGTWVSSDPTWSGAGAAPEPDFEPVVPIWRRPVDPPAPVEPSQPGGASRGYSYHPADVDLLSPTPTNPGAHLPAHPAGADPYPYPYLGAAGDEDARTDRTRPLIMPEPAPSSEQDIPYQVAQHRAVQEDTPARGLPLVGPPVWREAAQQAPPAPAADQRAGYDLMAEYPTTRYEQRADEPAREPAAEPERFESAGFQPQRYEPERYDSPGYESPWSQPTWNKSPQYEGRRDERGAAAPPPEPVEFEPAEFEPAGFEPAGFEQAEPLAEAMPEPPAELRPDSRFELRSEPVGLRPEQPAGLGSEPPVEARRVPPREVRPEPPTERPVGSAPSAPTAVNPAPASPSSPAGASRQVSGPPSRPVRPVSGPPSRPIHPAAVPPSTERPVGPAAVAPQPSAQSGPQARSAPPVSSAPPAPAGPWASSGPPISSAPTPLAPSASLAPSAPLAPAAQPLPAQPLPAQAQPAPAVSPASPPSSAPPAASPVSPSRPPSAPLPTAPPSPPGLRAPLRPGPSPSAGAFTGPGPRPEPRRPRGELPPEALPQRVPAEPDVPRVPEPQAEEALAQAPDLTRIWSHLRRDDLPPRPEGFDVTAVLEAVQQVPGVREAKLRTTPGGGHNLRLELADGADAAQVSRKVAQLLQEQMGLSASPREVSPADLPQAGLPQAGEDPSTIDTPPTTQETGRGRRRMQSRAESARGRAYVEPPAPQRATPEREPAGLAPRAEQVERVVPAPGPLIPRDRPGPRVLIDQVQVSTYGLDATVEVRLTAGPRRAVGLSSGPAVDSFLLRLTADAAVKAINQLLRAEMGTNEPPGQCYLEQAAVVPLGSCDIAIVVMYLACGGGVEQLTGSALVAGDARQSVVRATLAAMNRRLEALLS